MIVSQLKRIYWSGRCVAGVRLSRIGERLGLDALTYNAAVMDLFGHTAAQAAPVLVDAVLSFRSDIRVVSDFGCGTGHFVHAFLERGVAATGYERSEYARRYAADKLGITLNPFDLTEPVDVTDYGDLSMSLEVAEHLPPQLGEALVRVLADTAPLVLFSAAQPGQGGMGHINEQPLEYWQRQFAGHGFRYLKAESAALRERLRRATLSPWLSGNAMLFADDRASSRLRASGASESLAEALAEASSNAG